MDSSPRQTGRVKFFNSTKGYGFIIPDDQVGQPNIEEVFVHHTAIYNSGGFKSLSEGEQVEYDLVQGPKGMQAANVSGPGGIPVRGDPYASYIRNNDRYMQQHQQQQQPPPPAQFGYVPIPYGNVSQGFPQYVPPPQFYPSSPQMMPPMFFPPQFPSTSTTSSSTSNNNNSSNITNKPEGGDTM
ncbi:cold-shock' DNA-binding domain-containing protein [Fennellomyces sp. T-0311]|nr:cold-shock' DNA-binding domain-containing protein [Fennellomyces sp. T-0311]